MLTKVLDYEFSIQGAPIDRSGKNNHGVATATVATSGPGDLRAVSFLSPDSRIDIPHSESWNTITALQIDVRFRLASLSRRVNLMEITRSAALFVREDGLVTLTFYAPRSAGGSGPASGIGSVTITPPPVGSPDPFGTESAEPPEPPDSFSWQGLNTGAQFSPDGTDRAVTVGEYVTVRAVHNGSTGMRIYIDGVLAAERNDISYGVPPLLPPGTVSIGAWPHDNRYTLHGSVDFIRVWRMDTTLPWRQFFCRPMSEDMHKCWLYVFSSLAKRLENLDTSDTVRNLLIYIAEMLRDFRRSIDAKGEVARNRLQSLSSRYHELWCEGRIDGPPMQALMREFIAFLEDVDPDRFSRMFPDLLYRFRSTVSRALCTLPKDFAACDPQWALFLEKIADGMPDPFCPSECDRPRYSQKIPKNKERAPYKGGHNQAKEHEESNHRVIGGGNYADR